MTELCMLCNTSNISKSSQCTTVECRRSAGMCMFGLWDPAWVPGFVVAAVVMLLQTGMDQCVSRYTHRAVQHACIHCGWCMLYNCVECCQAQFPYGQRLYHNQVKGAPVHTCGFVRIEVHQYLYHHFVTCGCLLCVAMLTSDSSWS